MNTFLCLTNINNSTEVKFAHGYLSKESCSDRTNVQMNDCMESVVPPMSTGMGERPKLNSQLNPELLPNINDSAEMQFAHGYLSKESCSDRTNSQIIDYDMELVYQFSSILPCRVSNEQIKALCLQLIEVLKVGTALNTVLQPTRMVKLWDNFKIDQAQLKDARSELNIPSITLLCIKEEEGDKVVLKDLKGVCTQMYQRVCGNKKFIEYNPLFFKELKKIVSLFEGNTELLIDDLLFKFTEEEFSNYARKSSEYLKYHLILNECINMQRYCDERYNPNFVSSYFDEIFKLLSKTERLLEKCRGIKQRKYSVVNFINKKNNNYVSFCYDSSHRCYVAFHSLVEKNSFLDLSCEKSLYIRDIIIELFNKMDLYNAMIGCILDNRDLNQIKYKAIYLVAPYFNSYNGAVKKKLQADETLFNRHIDLLTQSLSLITLVKRKKSLERQEVEASKELEDIKNCLSLFMDRMDTKNDGIMKKNLDHMERLGGQQLDELQDEIEKLLIIFSTMCLIKRVLIDDSDDEQISYVNRLSEYVSDYKATLEERLGGLRAPNIEFLRSIRPVKRVKNMRIRY